MKQIDWEHWRGVGSAGLFIAAVIVAAAFALALGFARFDECLTDHPWWYCVGR